MLIGRHSIDSAEGPEFDEWADDVQRVAELFYF